MQAGCVWCAFYFNTQDALDAIITSVKHMINTCLIMFSLILKGHHVMFSWVCVGVCVLHLGPRCCVQACRPLLLPSRLQTPRWVGRFDWRSPWSRIARGRRSGSWCQATCRTAPGGPPPWWASPWSAPMPWQLAWKEQGGRGGLWCGMRQVKGLGSGQGLAVLTRAERG